MGSTTWPLPSAVAPQRHADGTGGRASFNLPASVNLAADANDSDGLVTKVEFLANGSKIREDTEAPYALSWSGMLSGNYALVARATDDDGRRRIPRS